MTEAKSHEFRSPDEEWCKLGLSAPARRALLGAGLHKVSDLEETTLGDLEALHGIGKSSIAILSALVDPDSICD